MSAIDTHMRKADTYLGISSVLTDVLCSTVETEAYPLNVLVWLSIALKMVQPYSLHLTSPVIRHSRYKDSIVLENTRS